MKDKYKLIVGIIIGSIIGIATTATIIYADELVLDSSDVEYNNQISGGRSKTVKGSIDELYEKAMQRSTEFNQDDIDMVSYITGESQTNESKTILAGKNGICIKEYGEIGCIYNIGGHVMMNVDRLVNAYCEDLDPGGNGDCYFNEFECGISSGVVFTCYDYKDDSKCSVNPDYIECA